MRKFLKRAAAGVVALAMCAGFAGCYSEDKTWAARLNEDQLPIGGYIYYLSSAYSEGAAQVGSDAKVLEASIEGESAESWVKNRAMEYLRSYYFVSQKFDELGLSLTEEDETRITDATNSMWTYYKTAMEKMGVAKDSFQQAYSVYNLKLEKLLYAMYGKGGELEVSQDEMSSYYTENYTYYQHFYVPFTTTDEEGNTKDMEEEEKADIKEKLEEYAEKVSSGDQTIDRAAANYANFSGTEPNVSEPQVGRTASMSAIFAEPLNGLEIGKATVIDGGTGCYVVQKLDISEDFDALIADETRTNTLLLEMKVSEFSDYTVEQGANVDVTINDKGINSVKLSQVAQSIGDKGTSSASSEAESSGAESSSAQEEVSSDESSEEESSEVSSQAE